MTFVKVLIQPFIMSWIRHFKSAFSALSNLQTCSSSSLFLHLASSSRPLSGQPGGTNQVTLNLTERYFWRLAATNLYERGIQNQLRLNLVEIYLSKLTTIPIKYPSKTCAVPFATTPLLGASIGGRALKSRWWITFLQTEFWHSPWSFCRILGWLCSTSCDRRNLRLVQLYVITSTWGFGSKKLWLKYDEEGRVSQTE